MNPLVSAICPTKDRAKYTALAVEQFLLQTYAPRELIICEDGDYDMRGWLMKRFGVLRNGAKVLKSFVRQGEMTSFTADAGVVVKYLRFEGTTGAKLNKCAQVASGEYLVRWDSDDWQHSRRIEAQVGHLLESGKAMVGLTSMVFYEEGRPHGWVWSGISSDPLGASQAFRRDWFLAHPCPDRSLSEDAAVSRMAWEEEQLFAVSGDHSLIVARDHDDNTGKRSTEEFRESPLCESFIKVELGGWYMQTVRPWVAEPLEKTPITRVPKKDWAAFAVKVQALQEKQRIAALSQV